MTRLLESFHRYRKATSNELACNEIMDLTPMSEFILRWAEEADYITILKEMFEPVDVLFPENATKFLSDFFSEVLLSVFYRIFACHMYLITYSVYIVDSDSLTKSGRLIWKVCWNQKLIHF